MENEQTQSNQELNKEQEQQNAQNSANENEQSNENKTIPAFDKRTAFETSLNDYDKLCAQNEDFAELQATHELNSQLDEDIAQNEQAIALKQKETEEKAKET